MERINSQHPTNWPPQLSDGFFIPYDPQLVSSSSITPQEKKKNEPSLIETVFSYTIYPLFRGIYYVCKELLSFLSWIFCYQSEKPAKKSTEQPTETKIDEEPEEIPFSKPSTPAQPPPQARSSKPDFFYTFLHKDEFLKAASEHDLGTMVSLIDQQVDVNVTDKDGNTALHKALDNYVETQKRRDKELKKVGRYELPPCFPPFDFEKLADILNPLLICGADPTIQNKRGQTPLKIAATVGAKEIMQLLITFGADLEIEDQKGRTLKEFFTKKFNEQTQEFDFTLQLSQSEYDCKKQEDTLPDFKCPILFDLPEKTVLDPTDGTTIYDENSIKKHFELQKGPYGLRPTSSLLTRKPLYPHDLINLPRINAYIQQIKELDPSLADADDENIFG